VQRTNIYCEHYKPGGAADTAIMVNGALATTVSFSQENVDLTILCQNAVAGIMPSRSPGKRKIEEDNIDVAVQVPNRLDLIDRFQVSYLVSASWGVSALLSLPRRPPTIEEAVVFSFSPVINHAMHDYMTNARGLLERKDIHGPAQLLNNTVGRYLPHLLKSRNHEYLLRMGEGNEQQIMFHIDQIFALAQSQYVGNFWSCVECRTWLRDRGTSGVRRR
jgi:rhamnosyltransferase subunit A